MGWESLRYDAKGIWNQSLKRYVYTNMEIGRADIYVFIPAGNGLCKVVAIDIKIGRDFQKPKQVEYQAFTESIGNAYILPKNWNDYYMMINEISMKL